MLRHDITRDALPGGAFDLIHARHVFVHLPEAVATLEKLKAGLKTEPVLRVSIDPSLIAGLVIRVGDRVFDGSVANQFELARRAMIARAIERIETKPETFVVA